MKTILNFPASLLLAGASLVVSLSAADTSVLAKIGDREIQVQDIKPYLANLSQEDRDALAKNPSALNQVVRSVVLQDLLYKEASESGWQNKPEIKEQIVRVQKGAVVETYLQAVTKVPDSYPGEAEITAAYEARKSKLIVPQQYKLAQIYIAAPKEADKAATDAALSRLNSVKAAVKAPGADFAAIARAQSEEPRSAAAGGEIGWLANDSLQPEIKSVVTGLAKGGVSEPIKLDDGWFILKVVDINASHTAILDEVRPQLVQLLRQDRSRMNREAYLGKLQQQNPMAINELNLVGLLSDSVKP